MAATEHDAIVIGLGPGGEEVSGRLARGGLDVLSVERKLVGGECPYWGCIPTKMMVRAGHSLAEAWRVSGLAGNATVSPDWAPVAKRIRDEATTNWDDQIAVERHAKDGETFVRGDARLVDARRVEVDGTHYSARKAIVIATGTEPAVPSIPGLSDVDFWTNRDAVEATEVPQTMLILGTGAIGVELGQVFARFGTKVTMIELYDHVLTLEEPENSEALEQVLRDEGIEIHKGAETSSVSKDGDEIVVELKDTSRFKAQRLLVATGRKTDLASLGVASAGLDEGARFISIDKHARAGDGLWAVGDTTGVGLFTHVAVYQGRIAAADILGRPHSPADYDAVPRVTFTDPEIASVGLSEKAAREKGLDVRIGMSKTADSTRGWIEGPSAKHGHLKLVANGDVLVGASLMSPGAGEIISFLTLAIREKVPIKRLRDLILPYPTLARGIEASLRELR